jgi:hypothetical protein
MTASGLRVTNLTPGSARPTPRVPREEPPWCAAYPRPGTRRTSPSGWTCSWRGCASRMQLPRSLKPAWFGFFNPRTYRVTFPGFSSLCFFQAQLVPLPRGLPRVVQEEEVVAVRLHHLRVPRRPPRGHQDARGGGGMGLGFYTIALAHFITSQASRLGCFFPLLLPPIRLPPKQPHARQYKLSLSLESR